MHRRCGLTGLHRSCVDAGEVYCSRSDAGGRGPLVVLPLLTVVQSSVHSHLKFGSVPHEAAGHAVVLFIDLHSAPKTAVRTAVASWLLKVQMEMALRWPYEGHHIVLLGSCSHGVCHHAAPAAVSLQKLVAVQKERIVISETYRVNFRKTAVVYRSV